MLHVRGGWQRDLAVVSRHPMTSTSDPKHWRDRANECRRIAELLTLKSARLAMLKVAEDYEDLALWAEGKRRQSPTAENGS